MANHTLNLQLLDQSNSLSNSDESSLCDQLENTVENQCGSSCQEKIQLLLRNAVNYEKEIKDLEIKLAKLEVNLSTYTDMIQDKEDAIAALKKLIDTSRQLQENQLTLSLKEKDDLLKQTEIKISHLQSLVRDKEFMLNSNTNQLLAESKYQVQARDQHIARLQLEISEKDSKIAFFEFGINMDSNLLKEKDAILSQQRAKTDKSVADLKEKNQRLTILEDANKKLTTLLSKKEALLSDLRAKTDRYAAELKENNQRPTILEGENKRLSTLLSEKEEILFELRSKTDQYVAELKQKNICINLLEISNKQLFKPFYKINKNKKFISPQFEEYIRNKNSKFETDSICLLMVLIVFVGVIGGELPFPFFLISIFLFGLKLMYDRIEEMATEFKEKYFT